MTTETRSYAWVTVQQPRPSLTLNQISKALLRTSAFSLPHAFAAWAVTSIHPLAGAVIGASAYVCKKTAGWICEKTHLQNNTPAKLVLWAISFFVSGNIGMFAVNAVGFPISFSAVILLHFQTLGVIVGGILCVLGVMASFLIAKILYSWTVKGVTLIATNVLYRNIPTRIGNQLNLILNA